MGNIQIIRLFYISIYYIMTMQQLERKARSEANSLWFAYLSEKNPVKAGRILQQRDQKMQQVHRIVANMLLAQY